MGGATFRRDRRHGPARRRSPPGDRGPARHGRGARRRPAVPTDHEHAGAPRPARRVGPRPAGRYLADLGHRRVALLAAGRARARRIARWTRWPPESPKGRQPHRAPVLLARRDRLGSPRGPLVDPASHGPRHRRRPRALVVLEVARREGLAVPWDLSVVAGRDSPVLRLSTPPVTALSSPVRALGAEAGRQVLLALGVAPVTVLDGAAAPVPRRRRKALRRTPTQARQGTHR
ncbi:substrate-binding domain-containing protein [Oerskovia sp. M15]